MGPVLDAYNNTPHSATKKAPNKVNKDNEIQVTMNLLKRAKKGNYAKLKIGDDVRVPVIHKQHKGYKDSFSLEIHKVENKDKELYQVDGTCCNNLLWKSRLSMYNWELITSIYGLKPDLRA